MSLTPDQIAKLLAAPEKKPRRGRKPKGHVDTSNRDVMTWFKLGASFFEEDSNEPASCSNPDCPDPRPEGSRVLVAVVNQTPMCRYCFLEGYQMVAPEQQELANNDS